MVQLPAAVMYVINLQFQYCLFSATYLHNWGVYSTVVFLLL